MLELLWLIFSYLLSLVVHELGHAWAARACGFDVDSICFGIGEPMARWRRNRINYSVGYPWTLFVGYVEYSDGNRGTIAQRLFVAVAGLLMNAALMVLANYGGIYLHQWDNYWAQLGVLNLWLIVVNLVPFVVMRRRYSKMWTDGGRILGLAQEKLTGRNFTDR